MAQMTYRDLRNEWEDDSDVLTAYTSGSTGTPAKILLPKGMVRQSAERTIRHFGIDSNWLLHSCIAPDFIGGKMMLIRALCCGAQFTYEMPSNRPTLDSVIATRRKALVSVVPSQMRHILDSHIISPHSSRIAFLIGGSNIPDDIRNDIATAGIEAWESYGMTETASHIALRPVTTNDVSFAPLPGISIDTDQRGCLRIDLGEHGIIQTNDIVQVKSNQQFTIIGRADDVIITGGKKVHPAQLEQAIAPLVSPHPICITSYPDALWSNRIVLLIESNDIIDIDSLAERMHQLLPAWQVPKEIRIIDKLRRTPSGKIIRNQKF